MVVVGRQEGFIQVRDFGYESNWAVDWGRARFSTNYLSVEVNFVSIY